MVARWQLLGAGVTPEQIRSRLHRGRLVEIHRGVYLAGAVKPAHADEVAALLVFRLDATLSHRTAAQLWELSPSPASDPVWVTVPPPLSSRRDRLKVVRSTLSPSDVRRRHGMRVTSPPRTLLDLAGVTPDLYELERLVAEASYRRLASEAELEAQLSRNAHRRGSARLRRVLCLPGGPRRTRSGGERALLRLFRERGIDGCEVNAKVAGFEVDFLFRAERLAVELDGFDAHSGRQAFERDRLKWAKLQAAGLAVMPVTTRQVRDDPDGVEGRLLAALRRG